MYPESIMCSICKEVLVDFGIEHSEARCPLRNSRYCSYCASYGHLTRDCYAKPSKRFTEPVFLEQLIGPSDLIQYGIKTKTPLPSSFRVEDEPSLLEIKDNDAAILAYLTSKSIKVPKKTLMRQQLEQYAELNHMRVVYLSS